MSLKTRVAFIYGHTITDENQFINFTEDSINELGATIEIGSYTLTNVLDATASALNEIGDNTYEVTVDRTTRLITISADANFDLLVTNGSQVAISAFPLLGFTTDRSGSNSYVADLPTGLVYEPQTPLYDYIPSDNIRESVQSVRNESSSGSAIEVINYGTRNFTEFEIKYATDIPQPTGKDFFVQNNPNGVSDLRDFLTYLNTIAPIEFIFDKTNYDVFESLILERTARSKDGTGFELRELYAEGLADYFSSGKLVFRRV